MSQEQKMHLVSWYVDMTSELEIEHRTDGLALADEIESMSLDFPTNAESFTALFGY